jgi:hypothetical protein
MTFLAPWAFAIGVLGALGVVVFHLVVRTRPAAYVLPTTRFIPDQRSLVSRVASRPRDLLLLVVRVLLLLVASAAFARPVVTPSRGTIAHVVLVDRSRAVESLTDEVTKARTLVPSGARSVVIVFDSTPVVLTGTATLDSATKFGRTEARGSLTAALVTARRASVDLAESVDSVALHIVSPVSRSEFDAGTWIARAAWPGVIDVQQSTLRADSLRSTWGMSRPISVADPLGPALATRPRARDTTSNAIGVRMPPPATRSASVGDRAVTSVVSRVSQLVRGPLSAADSTFAKSGGTVVRWDTAGATLMAAEGLAVGDDVIVAALGRARALPKGRVVARWADANPAAIEEALGAGCVRTVGVLLPPAGDLPLHPPFQRIARGLLAPCGFAARDIVADSSAVVSLAGGLPSDGARVAAVTRMASARELRARSDQPSPIARWLLLVALVLAVAELAVRARGPVEATA